MKAKARLAVWVIAFAAFEATIAAKGPIDWARNAFPLPESIWSVEAVDANGDGKLDVIAMGETKVFALAAPQWKTDLLVDTKEPKMLYCVAFDADGDKDLDIAVGRYQAPWIAYRQARDAGKLAMEPKGPDSAWRGSRIRVDLAMSGPYMSSIENSTASTACGPEM